MSSTTNDPYRFRSSTQTSDESQRRIDLTEHFEGSPLTTIEKLYNFSRYVPRPILTRFLSRSKCFELALEVQGSIMDCGVLFGSSLMSWAKLSAIYEPLNSQRMIVGFDTFRGFPSLDEKDASGTAAESRVGGFDSGDDAVFDDLIESVAHFDADRQLGHLPKVELCRGDITKTIPQYLDENPHTVVSLLHLDVDVYEPTKCALEHFVPRMPKGAVIVFDELNAKAWPGESIALMESVGLNDLRIRRFPWDTYLSYAVIGD